MPKVSVIIPCYNHGQYVEEAIDSVLSQTFKDFEIIVVDDGSTDKYTVTRLKALKKPKTKVIHALHQGLAEARNIGIHNSSGIYILPLDADDKISSEYLADAVEILDSDGSVKIVYCNAEWFGEKTGVFELPPFTVKTILERNIIVASAFFRRSDYDFTRGYNKNLRCVYEDWDFWLSLLETGGKVYKIPKVHFYYRFRDDSMRNSASPQALEYAFKQIYLNHTEFYLEEFDISMRTYLAYNRLRDNARFLINSYKFIRQVYRIGKSVFIHKRHLYPLRCRHLPRTYHFLMANFCNARCIFCNQRFGEQPKKEISLDSFKTIFSHIPTASAHTFHFSGGGEPFLCKDLLPIIKYVNELAPWIKIVIRTNGLLIKKYAKELAQLNISRIEISIHATASTNDLILQRNDSKAIYEGISVLRNYLEIYNKNMYISFIPTVSMLNIREIPELVKKARELKVDGIHVYFCRYFKYKTREGNTLLKEGHSLYFHKRLYNTTIRKSKKLAKKLGIDFLHDPLFYGLLPKKGFCCQPWENMIIDWDGDVYPCCGGEERFKEKVKSGGYHFGNLLKEHVTQCWNGPSYFMLRKTCTPGHKDQPIVECTDCHSTVYFAGPDIKKAHIIKTEG